MFSKACEYGIKAMIFIAQKSEDDQRVSLKEIAAEVNSPLAFTAKILQILSRDGLLISTKGPTGGFILAYPAGEMNIAQIVKAIDGDSIFTGCAMGLEKCSSEKPCPLHFEFAGVRNSLSTMLHTSTLDHMASEIKEGISFLTQ